MNEYNNQPANVFSDLQQGYALIEDINAKINKQYEEINHAKEELRQLKIDRNAYFTEFIERAKEIRSLCEQYSSEMDQVNANDEIRNNDEQLEKLRRKLTGENDDSDRRDLGTLRLPDGFSYDGNSDDRTNLGLSADRRDIGTRRFPEVL